MSTAPPARALTGWDQWYRRMLPAYWMFLFSCTHFPNLRLELGVPESDKLAHTTAFGLLAFLFWRFAETLRRPLSSRFIWKAWFVLGLYAGVDEYLQQFVGRSTDVADWLCNMLGISAVLIALELLRRRRASHRHDFTP